MSRIRWFHLAFAGALALVATPAVVAGDAPAAKSAKSAESGVSPEAVVEAQLAAYNRRDLDGFLSFYAEDAVLAKYPDQVTQTGKAEMRARYQRNFGNPNVRAEVLKRVTLGPYVIDHERVTALPAKGELEAVAIYEVRDGRIARVTFLEK